MLEQLRMGKHTPNLLAAQYHGKFLVPLDLGQPEVFIRQSFALQQEAKPVHRVLKIRLRGCFAPLLEFVEIILYLFGVQLRGQALEVQGHGRYMAAVVVKSSRAPAQNADVALKTLKKFGKTRNFMAGTVKKLVVP